MTTHPLEPSSLSSTCRRRCVFTSRTLHFKLILLIIVQLISSIVPSARGLAFTWKAPSTLRGSVYRPAADFVLGRKRQQLPKASSLRTFPTAVSANAKSRVYSEHSGFSVRPKFSKLYSTASPAADPDDSKKDVDASSLSMEGGEEVAAVAATTSGEETTDGSSSTTGRKSFLSKLKFWKDTNDDGLTTRQRLAKMGLSALLSYGFVSNMSYSVCLSLAWYGFSKKTGLSPLAPNQWPAFLAVYAGFWAFNNVIRPVRFAVAVVITPYFDRAVKFFQQKTNCSKAIAIGIVVFLANVVGTLSTMCLGVSLAAAAAGVPIFPPKL